MDEELELDLSEDDQQITRDKKRIENLSSKAKEAYTERDEARAALETAEQGKVIAENRAKFLEEFSEVATKYPEASEYKPQIEERVQKGYSLEDAAVAVLASEGKFSPQQEVAPITDSGLGGSAVISNLSGENRPFSEMSREEKRAQLIEADKRGELRQILEQRF